MNNSVCAILLVLTQCLSFAPLTAFAQGENKVTPKVEWEAETTDSRNGFGSILLDGDQIVAGDDQGALRAFRRQTGEILWTAEYGNRIYDAPVRGDDKIFFGSSRGVTSANRKTGEQIWSFDVQHGVGDCVYSAKHRLVITGGNDGLVYALRADTGESLWTLDIVKDAPADPKDFDGARARFGDAPARPSGIACDEQCVYLCIFDQCRVLAIDLETGKKKWSLQTGGWILPAPTISEDSVFVASQDDHLWRIDKKSGEVKWKFKTNSRIEGSCGLDGDLAYFGSCDGRFYAVNIKDGKEQWRFETDKGPHGRPIYSEPYITKRSILFAAGPGKLYSLEKETGALRWKFDVLEDSETYCDTISDGQRVFLVTRKSETGGKNAIVAIIPAE